MWYRGLNVTLQNFAALSKQFLSLVAPLLSESAIPTSLLRINDDNTIAFVKLDKNEIYVSSSILGGTHKFYGELPYQFRLEVCGGVVVHESAHIAFTPSGWLDVLLESLPKTANNKIIANLVEDVAIESLASMKNLNFKILLDAVNAAIFSDSEIESRIEKWNGEKPATVEELGAAINCVIAWKRDSYPFILRTDFEKSLYDLLMRAKNANNISIRAEITKTFIKMLKIDSMHDSKNDAENSDTPTFDSAGCEVEKDVLKERFAVSRETLKKPSAFVLDSVVLDSLTVFNTVPISNVFVEEIQPLNFSKFLAIENGRSAQRKLRGTPSATGIHMKNLAHYESGKIFGGSIVDGGRIGDGKPDITVLVDLSGSMREMTYTGKPKIKFALEAVSGLAKVLSAGGFSFSIFGHATGWTPNNVEVSCHTVSVGSLTTLIKLKGFDERTLKNGKVESLCKQFGGGNCDSAALLYCGSQFPNNNNKKIIIIISDGAPSARSCNYLQKNGISIIPSSGDPVSDTKKVVAHLRSKSINVFSLAIDMAAISPCEEIYGKGFSHYVEETQQIVDAIVKYTE